MSIATAPQLDVWIPGPVVPERKRQVPPRGAFRGARVDTPEAAGYKARIGNAVGAVWGKREPLEGPVRLEITAVRLRPKSAAKRAHPTTRPDLTNYRKLVEDALLGIVYRDDAQIVEDAGRKVFGDAPGLRVVLTRVEGLA